MQQDNNTSVIPTMRYKDAPAAIEWLCDVLGFERHLVVDGEGGTIEHAQLTLGRGMIMLGTARNDRHGQTVVPSTPAGPLTQSAYIVVADVETAYQRAKSANAAIVMELEPQHYGGSLFSVRDPEGQLWNIGSYDPWAPAEG